LPHQGVWNPTTKSSAKRVTIMSPRACVSSTAGPSVKDVMEVDVREERRCHPPCGVPSNESDHFPFSMTLRQPFLDEAQESFVRNAMLEELHQPSLIELEKKSLISASSTSSPSSLRFRRSAHRAHRGACARSEPVGEAEEVLLIYGIQHLDHRRWTILSSKVAMPSGRSRPSGFGMYTLRDGSPGRHRCGPLRSPQVCPQVLS